MNNKKIEFVQKIDNIYTQDDCVQVMIPHKGYAMTLISREGINYHYMEESDAFINKYLTDSRKENLPYESIPEHYQMKGLKKYKFVNQLLNFNEPYIKISDGLVMEYFAVKDNENALVVTKLLKPDLTSIERLSYEEVSSMYKKSDVLRMFFDGTISLRNRMVTHDDILDYYKDELLEKIEQEEESHEKVPLIKSLAKKYVEGLTIDDIPEGTDIPIADEILVSTEHDLSVTSISIKFVSKDCYEVKKYNFPVKNYSYMEIKELEKTSSIKPQEPKISSLINKDIHKEEIKAQKKLILARKYK